MQLFGALLSETILFPVPHRHFTFGIPKMLRPYFRYDRSLLKDLCRIAHQCLLEFMQTTLGLPGGIPGIVMTIHTFGEYLDFHPHLHMLLADGLFVGSGLFYLLPDVSLKPLEELFRARVITFLLDKGLLPPDRARMLRGWVHSGFNRNVPVKCASSRSSTTGRSSSASCATSDCGYRACASSRHARHRKRTNGSSNPATMTRSPACHGVAKRRRDYDTEPVMA